MSTGRVANEAGGTERELRALWDAGELHSATTVALRAYGRDLYRFLCASLGSAQAADDASSELWEEIWRGLPSFEWKCTFRTWAYLLARGAAAHALRSPHRRRVSPLSESQISKLEHEARTSLWRTDHAEDLLAKIRADLDKEDRSLLFLRVDRGLGFREVGFVLLGREPEPHEIANLRQKFTRLKKLLRERATAGGLLPDE